MCGSKSTLYVGLTAAVRFISSVYCTLAPARLIIPRSTCRKVTAGKPSISTLQLQTTLDLQGPSRYCRWVHTVSLQPINVNEKHYLTCAQWTLWSTQKIISYWTVAWKQVIHVLTTYFLCHVVSCSPKNSRYPLREMGLLGKSNISLVAGARQQERL